MGYIKHDTIVVTSWEDRERFALIHAKARALLGDIRGAGDAAPGANLVSDMLGPFVNGQVSFFIAPDGSKEGWDTSDNAENGRAAFLGWLATEARCYATALVARFGGDDTDVSVRVVEASRGASPEQEHAP